MRLEFGIWDHFERRPDISITEQYQQKIRLLQRAEQLGFWGYHIAEHHLTPLDLAPSPNVFLAALAQATTRLHIGTLVYILPLYHPVRLVQELVMLDHLSGGRLQVGIGRGARAIEHEWFGIEPTEARARNEEILQILVSALSSGNLAYRGQFYQIDDAPLDALPVQRPYPPLWYAGGADFAGRHGLNFITRTPAGARQYWEVFAEHRSSPERLNAHVEVPLAGMTKHLVIRPTDAEARELARSAWPAFGEHWVATSLRTPDGRVAPIQESNFDAALTDTTRLLVGSPETVGRSLDDAILSLRDKPSFYFAPAVQWGDLSHEDALGSLELFAAEVMPRLRQTAASLAGPSSAPALTVPGRS
jgi:alkanesulfonate monooxygenase SsuD/methylene tetrahydromethanopterin reductase-like flavin-dependent oxidoreductase (luciferase family)